MKETIIHRSEWTKDYDGRYTHLTSCKVELVVGYEARDIALLFNVFSAPQEKAGSAVRR